MEYGLRLALTALLSTSCAVLILVVMEYGLRRIVIWQREVHFISLNPCCNGIWSQTIALVARAKRLGLNPCCNGIWSQTLKGLEVLRIILS